MSARRRSSRRRNCNKALVIQPLERRTLFAFVLDSGFGQGGVLENVLASASQEVTGTVSLVHVLDDGKLLVAGGVYDGGEPHVRVVRYTPGGGQLDTTFNGDGLSPLVPTPSGSPNGGAALQGDGKILLGVTLNLSPAVIRFNTDGSVDTSFGGGDGIATVAHFGGDITSDLVAAVAIALAPDGKIVVVGTEDLADTVAIASFNSDGTLDTSFSGDGKLTINLDDVVPGSGTNVEFRAADIAALAGGKVLLLANSQPIVAADAQPILVQLNADGSFDSSFSGDGILPFKFGDAPSGNRGNAMLVQSGGQIVVTGLDGTSDDSAVNRPALTRFNSNGTLDTAFGTNGIGFAGTPASESAFAWDFATDSAGRFVAITGDRLLRWTAAGDADTTFGPQGEVQPTGLLFGPHFPLVLDAQDRVLTANGQDLVRLTEAPRPDLELSDNGAIIITGDPGTADNTVTIAQSGSNVAVTRNGVTTNFPAAEVRALDILMFDGDDTITSSIDVAEAAVTLGEGANTLALGDGDANITAGAGNDHITVGDGNHTILLANGDNSIVTGNGTTTTIVTGDGDDSIASGNGNDSIEAGNGNDTISAGGGNDTVIGGFGSDSIIGGAGNDLLVGAFDLTGLDSDASGVVANNVIHGGDGDDVLVGGDSNDSLFGGANKDILIGRTGSDLLSGGGGNDRIAGGGGNDRIYGGRGDDQLDGGVHDDRIFGGNGNDRLIGGRGSDILHGDAGDDLFVSDDGVLDHLDGGAGANIAFRFDEIDELLNVTAPG